VIFQMHYTSNGKAASDKSRIGFIFAKEPPKERVVNTFHNEPEPAHSAHGADPRFARRVTLYEDTKLLSLFPHMHVRGKGFRVSCHLFDRETETLLTCRSTIFQLAVDLLPEEPKVLPKGTVIECIAHYDNSPNQSVQPDAKSDVYWGDQTWEEMLAGFISLAMPVTKTDARRGRVEAPRRLRAETSSAAHVA